MKFNLRLGSNPVSYRDRKVCLPTTEEGLLVLRDRRRLPREGCRVPRHVWVGSVLPRLPARDVVVGVSGPPEVDPVFGTDVLTPLLVCLSLPVSYSTRKQVGQCFRGS